MGPTFAFIFVYNLIWITAWINGWLNSLLTQLVGMTFAFTLGALTGYIVLRYPVQGNWISGIITGFFFGVIVYIVVMAAFAWQSVMGMILFGIIFALIGLFIALRFRASVPRIASAFLGTYVFTMSCELFFGGMPHEKEIWLMIKGDEEIDFERPFWIYVGLSLLTFIGTAYF